MARITHHKLVRDHIPQKIEAAGDRYAVRTLSDEEFPAALRRKAVEEASELSKTDTRDAFLAEYADLMVVLDALAEHFEFSEAEIQTALSENLKRKGGFTKRIFLEWTETRDRT